MNTMDLDCKHPIPMIGHTTEELKLSRNFKSIFAQFLATFVFSLSFMMFGMLFAIPAMVNGDLVSPTSSLPITLNQASWYSSLLFISQPIGCLVGGLSQCYIGRRHGMLLTNAAAMISLCFISQVSSVGMIYISAVMMGITLGLGEIPCVTYVSEITEAGIRGTFLMYANVSIGIGISVTFFLNSFMTWRSISLFGNALPLVASILGSLVPESPSWLMNKRREKEALKALCWLRGWVPEENVKTEFEAMQQHIKISQHRPDIDDDELECQGKNSLEEARVPEFKISYLFEPTTIRPFLLLVGYEFFGDAASAKGTRNYLINILNTLNTSSISPQWIMFISSIAGTTGNIISMITVKLVGKRFLSLLSMLLSALSCLIIGVAIFYENQMNLPYSYVVLFPMIHLVSKMAINPFPWVLLGELYPTKTRSIAAGITAALYYVIMSSTTKTFPDLQNLMGTHGVFIIYGVVGFVGFAFLWRYLPETEGKTLSQIEEFYSKKK